MTLLVHYLWLLLSSLDYYQIYMIELIICEENGIVEGKIRVVTVANIDCSLPLIKQIIFLKKK